MPTFAILAFVRWVHFAAAMILFGSSLFPFYAPTGRFLDRPLRRIVIGAGVVGLITGLLWVMFLLIQLVGDSEGGSTLEELTAFFLDTSFGPAWIAHLALFALALLVGVTLRRNSWTARPQAFGLAIVAAGVLVSQALIGHAAAAMGSPLPGAAVHAIHLLASGAWIGGLVPLGLVLLGARRAGDAHSLGRGRDALRRFSTMGMLAVGLIILSGVNNALSRIDSPESLVATDYGRVLLTKVALFVLMVALAAINRFALLPRLSGRACGSVALDSLIRMIAAEEVVGMLILAAVAILGMLAPPL